jgi:NAD(P)-dependent dehydrogenase (short-subunit alcohol dehydrogenase family)
MNISDKTILITGANRGIGQALLNEALARGAKRVYAGMRTVVEHSDPRVTPLALDVTNVDDIQRAAAQIAELDLLINNAGIAKYDDLTRSTLIEEHFDVNFFGVFRMTQAFLPHLKRSKGAIINNLSLVALAPLPVIPSYAISKAAALNMTQSFRALLKADGVSVHASILGPIDTEMNRGLDIPKATTASAAQGIYDGLSREEEEIFPDPSSQQIAEGWRNGVAKALEHEFSAFVPATAAADVF